MTLSRHLTRFLSLAAAFALLAALLTGCSAPALDQFTELLPDSSSPPTTAPAEEAEEEYASYPHFTDRVITEKDHMLTLSNYKKNQFAFVYTLSSGGKELYQSEKIRPGESEAWDILQFCTESCTLTITITAYSLPDDREQNSVTQYIQLSMPEGKAAASEEAAASQSAGVDVTPAPGKTIQPAQKKASKAAQDAPAD